MKLRMAKPSVLAPFDQGLSNNLIAEFTGTSPEMFKKHYGLTKVVTEGHKFGNYSKERLK